MRTKDKIIQLILARLDVLPPDAKIAIVGFGTYDKHELKKHVRKDDDIGKKIIEIELDYLKSLKKGVFYA
ncbi:hypothetical protein A2W14_03650 [Candidatus Gottesmanbacteria bacterium RBG_16_37_8]|uniref:Uncharacterized protein n=1 Tax=Candidatus Gottesmanbacteria bacterium RBG_16_37_8 TaxID=1798371 RepID=A0A1F5YST3_9BACT|nr:MAG: hypothetical protein A2W14_03650 [Candidatus Gottesmanbacteria bacterium RBG_16_37_8]